MVGPAKDELQAPTKPASFAIIHISRDMSFPIISHFDMNSLRRACAATFQAKKLQMIIGQ